MQPTLWTPRPFFAIVLGALMDTDTPFAFMHGQEELLRGDVVSDVDLLVGRSPQAVIHDLKSNLKDGGLILTCWYDAGGALTIWLDHHSDQVVQLDMLWDPSGSGKLGIRTYAALDHCVPGEVYPSLNPIDEAIAMLLKRWNKGDAEGVSLGVDQLKNFEFASVRRRIDTVASTRAQRTINRALAGERPRRLVLKVRKGMSLFGNRGLERLRQPLAQLVRIEGTNAERRVIAETLARKLNDQRVECRQVDSASVKDRLAMLALRRRPLILLDVGRSGKYNVHYQVSDGFPLTGMLPTSSSSFDREE